MNQPNYNVGDIIAVNEVKHLIYHILICNTEWYFPYCINSINLDSGTKYHTIDSKNWIETNRFGYQLYISII